MSIIGEMINFVYDLGEESLGNARINIFEETSPRNERRRIILSPRLRNNEVEMNY